ncbi:hypothetical protein CcCBS67573_g03822 [Chytriomyces confervae]|uniref:Uncharacterized protein n=1 Tax=Chytriomyces confervae TaxID=246404 RepID=A0A507FIL5_9FUNG|nr:hypothetical protein CcCBS67573_g03822 [Chytriomyces confervae]
MALSGGAWDQETSSCKFTQNGETLFHYAGADLGCDALATAGAVVMLVSGRFEGVADLIGQLSLENVTRSNLTLILSLALMYLAHRPHLSFEVLSAASAIQNTTIIYLMDMEHVYSNLRVLGSGASADAPSRFSDNKCEAAVAKIHKAVLAWNRDRTSRTREREFANA